MINRIDAYDKAVTPGFIDLHAHGNPLETPQLENFLAMGVTTIVLGQDGSSPDVVPLSGWLEDVSNQGIGTNRAVGDKDGFALLSVIERSNRIPEST